MREGIKFIVDIVNELHDILIILINDIFGLQMTDKDMHFWVMGIIGIVTYAFVLGISKWLAKFRFGIQLIAFFYTLTFMFVLVFAIEIQQAITNRGNMDFWDAVIGLWGYIVLFLVYAGIVGIIILGRVILKNMNKGKKTNKTTRF
ncbi:hypothetical protein [Bacillus sp. PS06]|uniref:hypothetical protein n=1 Tax=Bacillus sp. PS06 TaxID=2764176 RepID=UPI00177E94B6|nr:hypothetical protein [Bacillus sp. PS06]MBD8071443.1 hypothetical protein [Bacillus sp. PS06]